MGYQHHAIARPLAINFIQCYEEVLAEEKSLFILIEEDSGSGRSQQFREMSGVCTIIMGERQRHVVGKKVAMPILAGFENRVYGSAAQMNTIAVSVLQGEIVPKSRIPGRCGIAH